MATNQSGSDRPSGRHQRKMRNYLLDRRFQLKYANFVAGIAFFISAALGILLWRASIEMVQQSQAAVAMGEEVVGESRKVSEVVKMNIIKDPIYNDNPILKEAFESDAKLQDEKLQLQHDTLRDQSARLQRQSRQFTFILLAVLAVLVGALWLAGIWITHKVAGPVYKMKKQFLAVERGDLEVPSALRKGDELREFFEAFRHMVRSMRARQNSEIDQITAIIRELSAVVSEEQLASLIALRDQMRGSLGATERPEP